MPAGAWTQSFRTPDGREPGPVSVAMIVNNHVTNADLGPNSVTGGKIHPNTVTGSDVTNTCWPCQRVA